MKFNTNIIEALQKKENAFYKEIVESIPVGKENGVSMAALAKRFAVHERDIRAIMVECRAMGVNIAGDNSGYYIPATYEEQLAYYRRVGSKIKKVGQSYRTQKRMLERYAAGDLPLI